MGSAGNWKAVTGNMDSSWDILRESRLVARIRATPNDQQYIILPAGPAMIDVL